MSGYAVIGWGSLIWDLYDLAPHVTGGWRMGAGPALPLEFCRISPKRKQALVVVIDPDHGTPCPSHVIASRRGTLEEARRDLASRERAPEARIGAVCLAQGIRAASRPEIAALVWGWCEAGGWRGAVWTDLPANFAEATGTPFSIDRGRAYLGQLTGESLAEAVRYIESAPAGTDTPLRRALASDPWWQGLAQPAGGAGRQPAG